MHIIQTAPGFTFVPHGKAVDTLFQPIDGRTAAGTYKRTAGGVTFYTLAGEPFAHLVINRQNARFFVTASRAASGRVWYMHALSTPDADRLGLSGLTYSEELHAAERIAAQVDTPAAEDSAPLAELIQHHCRTIARIEAQALRHPTGRTADTVRALKQCAL